jgi:hypothetical protein
MYALLAGEIAVPRHLKQALLRQLPVKIWNLACTRGQHVLQQDAQPACIAELDFTFDRVAVALDGGYS